jgi:hypothetical protein
MNRDWTMNTGECWCYRTCRACSHSGTWHVHPGERCPVHPDAPGDWSAAERAAALLAVKA